MLLPVILSYSSVIIVSFLDAVYVLQLARHNIVECMNFPYCDAAEQYHILRAEFEWRRAVVH